MTAFNLFRRATCKIAMLRNDGASEQDRTIARDAAWADAWAAARAAAWEAAENASTRDAAWEAAWTVQERQPRFMLDQVQ